MILNRVWILAPQFYDAFFIFVAVLPEHALDVVAECAVVGVGQAFQIAAQCRVDPETKLRGGAFGARSGHLGNELGLKPGFVSRGPIDAGFAYEVADIGFANTGDEFEIAAEGVATPGLQLGGAHRATV